MQRRQIWSGVLNPNIFSLLVVWQYPLDHVVTRLSGLLAGIAK